MTDYDPQTLDPRSAYRVKRYHTWPMHQTQSVGEHSAQIWRILKAIWPGVPHHVLEHAMTHDVGERITGDLPYPVKAHEPKLRHILNHMEHQAHEAMSKEWSLPLPITLPPDEEAIFKLAEYIEMWECALDDITMGNREAALIAQRMWTAIEVKRESGLPLAVVEACSAYLCQRIRMFHIVTGESLP